MQEWVFCPYCHKPEECYFDGYEYECPTTGKTFEKNIR